MRVAGVAGKEVRAKKQSRTPERNLLQAPGFRLEKMSLDSE